MLTHPALSLKQSSKAPAQMYHVLLALAVYHSVSLFAFSCPSILHFFSKKASEGSSLTLAGLLCIQEMRFMWTPDYNTCIVCTAS